MTLKYIFDRVVSINGSRIINNGSQTRNLE